MVHVLKVWRQYTFGNLVHIYTDHKSLKYLFTQADLNMRQWRWLELIKDYELEIHYHPGRANVVTDALSQKEHWHHIVVQPLTSGGDLEESSLRVIPRGALNNIALIPSIKEDVIVAQKTYVRMGHIWKRLKLGEVKCFHEDVDGVLWFKNCLVVPKDFELRHRIVDESHCSRYSIHPWTNKMYQDLKKNFWCTRMKWEIVRYVAECDTCWRVKADHPVGNPQSLSIPEWKWEDICMDFTVGLSRNSSGYNSIWVIVDHLTKSAHFIPVITTYKVNQYAELYITHIIYYPGIPKTNSAYVVLT
jgi:hypothetical protein